MWRRSGSVAGSDAGMSPSSSDARPAPLPIPASPHDVDPTAPRRTAHPDPARGSRRRPPRRGGRRWAGAGRNPRTGSANAGRPRDRPLQSLVRHQAGAPLDHDADSPRQGDGAGRPEWLREVDPPPQRQPAQRPRAERPHQRRDAAQWRPDLRQADGRHRAAKADGDGVPAPQSIPDEHLRERRLCPADRR